MLLFVNDLTVIDFSYLCPERGIVGESWIVDIVLDGRLNEQSMVLDFGRVKKQIKKIIDESVDHKLAVPAEHPYTRVQKHAESEQYWVDFMRPEQASIHLYCPADAFAFIDAEQVDKASVMAYLRAVIRQQLPENVEQIELTLREEQIDGAFYHYTHGLKKHDGNCQRIAHGHRSRIHIEVNGQRDTALEQKWAERWRDIYIGSSEDRCQLDALERSEAAQQVSDRTHIGYGYDADQGRFELILPQLENDLIDADSTVECIAEHIAQTLKRQNPQATICVRAFEGVGKGAISYA